MQSHVYVSPRFLPRYSVKNIFTFINEYFSDNYFYTLEDTENLSIWKICEHLIDNKFKTFVFKPYKNNLLLLDKRIIDNANKIVNTALNTKTHVFYPFKNK